MTELIIFTPAAVASIGVYCLYCAVTNVKDRERFMREALYAVFILLTAILCCLLFALSLLLRMVQ